jgi:hypothetical protein
MRFSNFSFRFFFQRGNALLEFVDLDNPCLDVPPH